MMKDLKIEEIKWKTRNVKDKAFLNDTKVEASGKKISLRELICQPNNLDARIEENDWLKLICKNNHKHDFTDGKRKMMSLLDNHSIKVGDIVWGNLATLRGANSNGAGFGAMVSLMDQQTLSIDKNWHSPWAYNWVDMTSQNLSPYIGKEIIFDLKVNIVNNIADANWITGGGRYEPINIKLSPRQQIFDKLKGAYGMNEIEKSFNIGYDEVDDYRNEELQSYRRADIPKHIAKIVIAMKKNDQGDKELKSPLIDTDLVEEVKAGYKLGYTTPEDYLVIREVENKEYVNWRKRTMARLLAIKKNNLIEKFTVEELEKAAENGNKVITDEKTVAAQLQIVYPGLPFKNGGL